jgi:hypothetical protein
MINIHSFIRLCVDIDIEATDATLLQPVTPGDPHTYTPSNPQGRSTLSASTLGSLNSGVNEEWRSASGGSLNLFQEFPSPDTLHIHAAVIEYVVFACK